MNLDLDYPRMLYRKGGAEMLEGTGYATRIVKDEAEHLEQKAKGWCDHWHAAKDAKAPATPAAADAPKPAMSRADLETCATALEIKFDGRTSDAKLARLVDEARAAANT